MPFDGNSPNVQVINVLNTLMDYFKIYKDNWEIADTDIAYALKRVREHLKIRKDKTAIYIIQAAKKPMFTYITLADLDYAIQDYAAMENILLRARDLASGEPMRESTWHPRPNGCQCTADRACLITESCLPARRRGLFSFSFAR